MIKIALVMQVCFSLTQTCLPPIKSVEFYDTHKDCSLAGYKNAYAIIESRPNNEVNKQKAMITFWCLEEKVEDT